MSYFDSVASKRPKLNAFNLTTDHLTTINMGDLVPIYCEEVVPGDNFRISTDVLVRVAPMLAPTMANVETKIEFFYVPNRIIWSEWEDFITRGQQGLLDISIPQFSLLHCMRSDDGGSTYKLDPSTLANYLGFPILQDLNVNNPDEGRQYQMFSQLPFRAYQMIYNDYYRNPNLSEEVDITSLSEMFTLRKRQWGRDYFTTSLPWVQRGPGVTIPIGDTAPLFIDGDGYSESIIDSDFSARDGSVDISGSNGVFVPANDGNSTGKARTKIDVTSHTKADLSQVTGIAINDLRKLSAIQRWFEAAARFGSRYIDTLQGFFGQRPLDLRLDRPAYIGSSSTPIRFSEVLQTSSTTDDSPQANMAGHGFSFSTNFNKDYQVQDFGFIVGIVSIVPKAQYMQGLRKFWMKDDPFDFYFPQFAQLGEQPVDQRELYFPSGLDENGAPITFGYQSRYAEYKFSPNRISGAFADSLDFWHMARKFGSSPRLNEEFVEIENITRPFPVEDLKEGQELFYLQSRFHVKALRPMPVYNIPTLN